MQTTQISQPKQILYLNKTHAQNSKTYQNKNKTFSFTFQYERLTQRKISFRNISNNNTVAVCTLARSKSKWNTLQDSDLYRFFLKGVHQSTILTSESFKITLHVGINSDDYFFVNRIEETVHIVANEFGMKIIFHKFNITEANALPMNLLMQSAADTGAEYLVRLNDDTEIITKNWIKLAVHQLQSFSPPNIGVVGPVCHEGNTAILTHDMVHRKHLDIFKNYYPQILKNWYIDDWISSVYGPTRTIKLKSWVVIHHIEGGTRYKPEKSQHKLLQPLIDDGKQQIQNYLHTNSTLAV